MVIDRPAARASIHESFSVHPAVALVGPRQCGKTTLARVALSDLELEHLWVVYPGDEAYALDDRISVLPVANVPALGQSLGAGENRGAQS